MTPGETAPPAGDVKEVRLRWTGEGLAFEGGRAGAPEVVIDGDSEKGPSPMDALLLSLAGCMAIDVRVILEKSRVHVEELEVEVVGQRAPEDPRRYVRIDLVYRIRGPGPDDRPKLERAVRLSKDTYCSVLHSLRPDIEIGVEIALV